MPDLCPAQAAALYRQGRLRQALDLARQGLAARPADADLALLAAAAAMGLGLADEAEGHWRAVIAARPDCAEAHNNLGTLLKARGRYAEAAAAYQRALAIRPDYAEAHNNLGNLLHQCGQQEAAEAALRTALRLHPRLADAHNGLGILLKGRGQAQEAEAAFRQALAIRPDYAEAHYNLGNLLLQQGRLEQAEAAYRQALAIRPDHAPAHNNLANTLKERGHLEQAAVAYRRALELRPQYAEAAWNLAALLLSLGRFEQGWPLYEARHQRRQGVGLPALPFPRWQGEALAGKSLLLLPEQGFGDQIQFARYVAELKRRGAARVDLCCAPALTALFATLPGVDAVLADDDTRPPVGYDYWAPLLSLPLHLATTLATIPAHLPYLHAEAACAARWAARLPSGTARVGLAWRGRPQHPNDAHRSLPDLRTLAPLWSVPGVVFIGLQPGADQQEADLPLLHLGPAVADFADTAAIVSQLDLIISVDTALAHLAGALGKPCWVLLPHTGTDWRWLRGRADSPWYPGVMRLYRQGQPGDWQTVVAQVAADLHRFVSARPAGAAELFQRAVRLHDSQPDQAEVAYRQVLALCPDSAEAHNNLANLLHTHGRPQEAEVAYRRALAVRPDYADAHRNLGLLLREHGRPAEAEAAWRRALALRPDDAAAHHDLAVLLREGGRAAEAEAACRRALDLAPGHAPAHNTLGLLLREHRRPEAAEAALRQALVLHPGLAEAHYNLGLLLQEGDRAAEAEAAFRQVLAIHPDHADAHHNLAGLLQRRGQPDAAEAALRRALALRPDDPDTLTNLGHLLKELDRPGEAEAALRRALELAPRHPEARWDLSLLLLSLGRFAEGWAAFEARWDPAAREPIIRLPTLPFPRWQGEALAGKALLLVPEQGFGDQIQFCRYVPVLKRRGAARVDILCDGALAALFATLDGVDAVFTRADDLLPARHDYWTFPLSVPRYLGTTLATLPADLPYLRACPERAERWAARLPPGALRVGLVWKGNDRHKNDAHRSLPGLRTLAPLWSVPGVVLVGLQPGTDRQEAGLPLLNLGPAVADFADTAAIVRQLDLIISVDTALAHLAGALGKPCWVLLPRTGTDWRWLRGRADSPWYPGVMRLFRQQRAGEWDEVVAEVVEELRGWAGAKG